jgi:transcriptional regulator with XRE-family HTH domain
VASVPQHRKRLGQKTRTARNRSGLNQDRLAEKSDLHPVHIRGIECGEHNVSIDSLKRVAQSLGVLVVDMVSGL